MSGSVRDDRVPFAPLGPGEPRHLGRYALRYRIAEGGMGTVYLAQVRDAAWFGRWIAIKVIHAHLARDPAFVRMFADEARIAARIDHPNVGQVFDFGEQSGRYFLAMDYQHGESLRAVLEAARPDGAPGLPRDLAVRIVCDAARGLHAAHEKRLPDGRAAGIVHRDVSPRNLFVRYDGTTRVVDFGVARAADRLTERTRSDVTKGRTAYLAPERIEHGTCDHRADIYALGIVLWEATTGARLFQRESELATSMAIISGDIPRPTCLRADHPADLEQIVLHALALDPDARFATAGALARALERHLASRGFVAGIDEVADFMRSTFAARIAARDRVLAF